MPISIGQDDQFHHPRVLLERRRRFVPSSPPLSINDGLFLQSLSYRRLPQQLLKLSVLKLDGCVFDVHVARNATIAELKQAVEEVFSSSPKEGQGKISWSHVWGHFCLCYEGQKLINDKDSIRNFSIKDGDQLQFIRHMSISHDPMKKRSRNPSVAYKWYSMLSSESNLHEEDELNSDHEDQEDTFKHNHFEDGDEIPLPEFKLAHFLRGRLSYARLWGVSRKGTEGRSRPSRFDMHLLRRWNQDDPALRVLNHTSRNE